MELIELWKSRIMVTLEGGVGEELERGLRVENRPELVKVVVLARVKLPGESSGLE